MGRARAHPSELTSDVSDEAARDSDGEATRSPYFSAFACRLTGCASPGVMVVSHSWRSVGIPRVNLTEPADAKAATSRAMPLFVAGAGDCGASVQLGV